MKKTTFFVLLIFGSLQLFAQDYKTAIGARLGSYGSAGLSLKHFTNETYPSVQLHIAQFSNSLDLCV